MSFEIIIALFYAIPIAALIFFAVSLVCYIYARVKNKKVPDTFTKKQMTTRLVCLVISSVITGVMAAVVIGFVALLTMAVAFM